jgi:hypothetical protein
MASQAKTASLVFPGKMGVMAEAEGMDLAYSLEELSEPEMGKTWSMRG